MASPQAGRPAAAFPPHQAPISGGDEEGPRTILLAALAALAGLAFSLPLAPAAKAHGGWYGPGPGYYRPPPPPHYYRPAPVPRYYRPPPRYYRPPPPVYYGPPPAYFPPPPRHYYRSPPGFGIYIR
jgi:hypothetical protein